MRGARSQRRELVIGLGVGLVAGLMAGCSAGDGRSTSSLTTFGPSSASGTTAGTEGGASTGDGATSGPPPAGSAGGDNDSCCASRPTPGCGDAAIEACVCAELPTCCETLWSYVCVGVAGECGAAECTDGPPAADGGGTTTGAPPPPGDTGEPPPPDPPPMESPCPCMDGVNNFCCYAVNDPNCPPTQPGGYCDPNGDGSFDDAAWDQGWYDYDAWCGPSDQGC